MRAGEAAAKELFDKLNESVKSARYPDGESIQGFAYKNGKSQTKRFC